MSTILIEAIVKKNIKQVKKLIGKGACPNSNVADNSGLSAMHFACQSSDDIFKFLLDHGGSIFKRDSDGTSVFDCSKSNRSIHNIIIKHMSG